MQFIAGFFLTSHLLLLVILSLFGMHRLSMVLRWFRYRHITPKVSEQFSTLPTITVQIPLYNEKFVAERIIHACANLHYPKDKLQVQVVDDSTDDTSDIVKQAVQTLEKQGINIVHIQRAHRSGFKAGALKEAMRQASGEFIAIFDADFVPPPNLLIDNIHYFTSPDIGMVQFRWEHLNRQNTANTKAQAIMLDAHFGLEQQVRWASHCLFNFNGTAGIWRKRTIIDAGNWQADTLTEDLDLSYRAQMKGWQMIYLNHVTCPGELPADMSAFKSQQHRWAKGGVEVLLKMLRTIWRQPFSFGKKLEATFHLSNNLAYLVMLIDSIFFLLPSILIREYYGVEYYYWLDLPLLFFASAGHLIYLFFSQVALNHSKLKAFVLLPQLMLMGIQLAFNNARAGFEALTKQRSEFVRTPKTGELQHAAKPRTKTTPGNGYRARVPNSALVELILSLVYMAVFTWAIANQLWITLPFLAILSCGFLLNGIANLRQLFTAR